MNSTVSMIRFGTGRSRKMYISCLLTALCGGLSQPVGAQESVSDNAEPVGVRQVEVVKSGRQVQVRFDLVLDSLNLTSNQSVRLTPLLVRGDSVAQLTPITIAGRRRYLVGLRQHVKGVLERRRSGRSQTVSYSDAVSYRPWMNNSQLVWAHQLCGCSDRTLAEHTHPLREVCFEVPVYEVSPVLAFAAPRVEAVKHREESGRAYLDFPVNQTVIYPEYRRNLVELDKIKATIDLVRNDSNTSITHINIHGYASPEGSYANNRRLASGRAEALKQYVRNQYAFSDTLFTVASTPEDWEGLRKWVEQSAIDRRDEVLQVIASSVDEDEKNSRLQRMGDGSLYAHLLREVYPALRHSDYTVHYTVRPFSVDEARRLLHTRPQLLSLDEMYRLASTYEAGSPEFNEVFDIAVRLFPDDPTANLNAALVSVGEQNYPRAARYLEKAGESPEAVHARGVCALMTGEYDEAERLLRQAQEQGLSQAEENLKQLELKRENLRKIAENQ